VRDAITQMAPKYLKPWGVYRENVLVPLLSTEWNTLHIPEWFRRRFNITNMENINEIGDTKRSPNSITERNYFRSTRPYTFEPSYYETDGYMFTVPGEKEQVYFFSEETYVVFRLNMSQIDKENLVFILKGLITPLGAALPKFRYHRIHVHDNKRLHAFYFFGYAGLFDGGDYTQVLNGLQKLLAKKLGHTGVYVKPKFDTWAFGSNICIQLPFIFQGEESKRKRLEISEWQSDNDNMGSAHLYFKENGDGFSRREH